MKPVKELKAFRKVYLEPQESKTLSIRLERHAFESYDPNLHARTMEEGYYELAAGLSSDDMHTSCKVYADVESPYSYGANTSVKIIMEKEELKSIAKEFFEQKGLPWAAMLTSYRYTAQDTIEEILEQVRCAEGGRKELYRKMRNVEKQ